MLVTAKSDRETARRRDTVHGSFAPRFARPHQSAESRTWLPAQHHFSLCPTARRGAASPETHENPLLRGSFEAPFAG